MGPAVGGDEGDGEGLKKVDDADNEVQEDHRADQRDGDTQKAPEVGCAVNGPQLPATPPARPAARPER